MFSFSKFPRIPTLAVLLTTVSLAAAQASTYGYWESVNTSTDDGQTVCGVRTSMQSGGTLGLVVQNGQVHLFARDPNWHISTGAVFGVSITIDDERFSGRATAADSHMLIITAMSDNFLSDFIGGNVMYASFGGVPWNVDLSGSRNATAEMVSCATAGRGYNS